MRRRLLRYVRSDHIVLCKRCNPCSKKRCHTGNKAVHHNRNAMCSPCKKDTRHAGNVKTADLCQHIDGIGRIRLIDGNCFFNRCNFPRKTFTRKPGAPSRQFRNRLIQENGCHCTARRRISNAHLTGCHQLIARRNFFFRHGDSCFKRTNGLFPCHRRTFCHIFCSIRNFIPRNLRIARHSDINRKQIRMRAAAENGCCRLLLQKIFRNCRCHFLTALRHVFFHNAIVRTERQKCSFFNRNLLFSGDSGNLDEHVLQLSEAVERLCNAVPVSLGTIHRLFRKRMDLFDCFL